MAQDVEKIANGEGGKAKKIDALGDIPVKVTTVIGRANVPVSHLLHMKKGNIVELDRQVGDTVEIFVNGQLVARGDLVMTDGRLGVSMTEIVKSSYSKP